MSGARRVAGAVAALLFALGLAALSRGTWSAHPGDEGVLRLTWSIRPERIEACRRLTPEELADRPAHMRQEVACEGRTASYRLQVWRGEALLDDEVLRGGGVRRDRPINLLRDYALPPGAHDMRVELHRVEAAGGDSAPVSAAAGLSLDRAVREEEERRRRALEAVPAELVMAATIAIAPRQVVLITWDPEGRRLRVVR